MKKLAVATLALTVASVAFASTLAVPFFLDNGAGTPLSSGNAGFIGIVNNTGENIAMSVYYRDSDLINRTPAMNSFTLGANAQMAWRPAIADAGSEGPGVGVPDMNNLGDKKGGSAIMAWIGGAQDVQGRYYQKGSDGSFGLYLLPPGQEG